MAIVKQGSDAVSVALSAEYDSVVFKLIELVCQVLDYQQIAKNLGLIPNRETCYAILAHCLSLQGAQSLDDEQSSEFLPLGFSLWSINVTMACKFVEEEAQVSVKALGER